MRTAALLLADSTILLDLSVNRALKARSIAANFLEYGFCSDLTLKVEEKVPSFGLR